MIRLASAATLCLCVWGTPASADLVPVSDLAPLAFVEFCGRYPDECRPQGEKVFALEETIELWDDVAEVNTDVNATIAPSATFPGKRWRIAPVSGDCNDYAVTKRHLLLAKGWPSSVLRLAAVETRAGIAHLVLLVRTANGDLVLDNLTPDVRRLDATGYVLLKEQVASDPNRWVRYRARLAGSFADR